MEFFAADAKDAGLNAFLSRFNPNASVFPWSAQEFIGELEAMIAPNAQPVPQPPVRTSPGGADLGTGPTVFVSYASEDADAARLIAQSLPAIGFSDVWLDKRKLIAGDDWSDHIDEAIEHCDFFMPVLSRQADQRREGVFWEEWRKAVTRAMNDAFLLPAGIDATHPIAPATTASSTVSPAISAAASAARTDGMLSDGATAQLRPLRPLRGGHTERRASTRRVPAVARPVHRKRQRLLPWPRRGTCRPGCGVCWPPRVRVRQVRPGKTSLLLAGCFRCAPAAVAGASAPVQ